MITCGVQGGVVVHRILGPSLKHSMPCLSGEGQLLGSLPLLQLLFLHKIDSVIFSPWNYQVKNR